MSPEEFTSLYRASLPQLSKFLTRRVRPSDVEDLASRTFEIAWQKKHQIPKGFELAWLYRIAGYVVANHRRKLAGFENLLDKLAPDSSPAAEDIALSDLALADAWDQLSRLDRQAISLVSFDGLSNKAAAAVMELSPNAFNLRLSRARLRLRKLLEG